LPRRHQACIHGKQSNTARFVRFRIATIRARPQTVPVLGPGCDRDRNGKKEKGPAGKGGKGTDPEGKRAYPEKDQDNRAELSF
jgi:hypothetical protein